MQLIKFIGTVSTGQGHGKFFVEKPWVIQQLKELIGIIPYAGTLNLQLSPEGIKQRVLLTRENGIMIKPENGYLHGYLYKALIFDVKCSVILPDIPNYPKDLLEIIAAENLRALLNVKNGDEITIMVTL